MDTYLSNTINETQRHQHTPNIAALPAEQQLELFNNSIAHSYGTLPPFITKSDAASLNSSPTSTYSSVWSQDPNSPAPIFQTLPSAVPRGGIVGTAWEPPAADFAHLQQTADPMQIETWAPSGPVTPRSGFGHQRESSLSSMGSFGPASPAPYAHGYANPHIAVTEPGNESYQGYSPADDVNYHLVSKSYQPVSHDEYYASFPHASVNHSATANNVHLRNPANGQLRTGAGLLSPDQMIGSRPVSVASSVVSDSPATPADHEHDEHNRRQRAFGSTVPKLERTITDVFSDELYRPEVVIGSTSSAPVPVSPSTNAVFTQRLQAANNQHLTTGPLANPSRGRSPFRNGSPLAPSSHDFAAPFPSQKTMREQARAAENRRAVQQQQRQQHQQQQQMANTIESPGPQTISPRDALLEFPEGDEPMAPLFPQPHPDYLASLASAVTQGQAFPTTTALDSSFTFIPPSQGSTGLPNFYPFVSHPTPSSSMTPLSNGSLLPVSRMGSTETGANSSNNSSPLQRPAQVGADTGTYSCTYHGCTHRFQTPTELQRHKKEGHRQAHGPLKRVGARAGSDPHQMTQNGPHKCMRINPSTGKPCNVEFSRPYDLTRHEGTIHNINKAKVRCPTCTEEKTFSRGDALNRHYRVCHPGVPMPGKHAKRRSPGPQTMGQA